MASGIFTDGKVGFTVCGIAVGFTVCGIAVGSTVCGIAVGSTVCGIAVGSTVCGIAVGSTVCGGEFSLLPQPTKPVTIISTKNIDEYSGTIPKNEY